MIGPTVSIQFNNIEHDKGSCNNYRLAGFQSIDSSINVYSISAENSQHSHV
jgi:hypothetical protein